MRVFFFLFWLPIISFAISGTKLTAVVILVQSYSIFAMLANTKVGARVDRHSCIIRVFRASVHGFIKLVTPVERHSSQISGCRQKLLIAIETKGTTTATRCRFVSGALVGAKPVVYKLRPM